MKILVTHLTRMKAGRICVAGINPQSGLQIRPVAHNPLTAALLKRNGGAFEIGALVELGAVTRTGRAPEFEDHRFRPDRLQHLGLLPPGDFWSALLKTCGRDLTDVFGPALTQTGRSCTVTLGRGDGSLGHLSTLRLSGFGLGLGAGVRIEISDDRFRANLSVADIRLYEDDHKTPRTAAIIELAALLPKSAAVLALGLSRPFAKDDSAWPCHWLQVNNIHLESDPLGAFLQF